MSVSTYLRGSTIKINATTANEVGVLVDPVALTLLVKKPDGSTDTYSYPDDMVRDGPGRFSVDFDCVQPGRHFYRWESVTPAGADEGQFIVSAGEFP